MQKPLSDHELRRLLPNVPVIKYSDLAEMNYLPEVCVILLEWKAGLGHWVCLWHRNGHANYFNSLGERYDSDLSCLARSARVILGEEGDEITRLLNGARCEWNKTKYQTDTSQTCGRHCVNRIRDKQYGAAAYKKKMDKLKKEFGSYDDAILALVP